MNKRIAALLIAAAFTVGVLSAPAETGAQLWPPPSQLLTPDSPLPTPESPLPTPTPAPTVWIDCGGQPVPTVPSPTPWPTTEPTWTAIPEVIVDCGGQPVPTAAPTTAPIETPTPSAYYQGPCGQCPIAGLCNSFPADATCIIVLVQ